MNFKRKTLVLLVSLLSLCSCNNTTKHDVKEYILNLDYKNNFKVLQLTDLHLGDIDNLEEHFKFMDLTINETKPDLIVVTGDVYTFSSKPTSIKVMDYFDSHKIPWTFTFGNHDEQAFYSIEWLTETLNNYGSYCYFKDIQGDSLTGNCNFAINLNKDNKVHTQLIMMDSNRYYFGEIFEYDYVKENQIEWYKDLINTTTKENGSVVPSLYFAHIPLPEINAAFENGTLLGGEKRENPCPPVHNSGLFQVMKDLGSTKAMFYGHDHKNTFSSVYEGIIFTYGVKSTDRVYYENDMLGGTLITIHDDNSLQIDRILHTYEEIK